MSFSCSKAIETPFELTKFDHVYRLNLSNTSENSLVSKNNLTFGVVGQLKTLNPFRVSNESTEVVSKLLHSTLVYKKINGEFDLNCCESCKILDDGRKYYFKLKQNIAYVNSKGKKVAVMKSSDVIATIQCVKKYLKNTRLYSKLFYNNKVLLVERISDFEFNILLDKQNPDFFVGLADLPILHKKDLDKIKDFSDFILTWTDNIHILTSGSYFISSVETNKIILTKNSEYLLSANDIFSSENIILKLYDNNKKMTQDFVDGKLNVESCHQLDDLQMIYKCCESNDKIKILDLDFNNYCNLLYINPNRNIFFKNMENRLLFRNAIYKKMQQVSHVGLGLSDDVYQSYNDKDVDFSKYNLSVTLLSSDSYMHKLLVRKLTNAINSLGIKVHTSILPYHLYIQHLNYDKDFDFAIVDYYFDGTISKLQDFALKTHITNLPNVYEQTFISNEQIKSFEKSIKNAIDENILFASVFYNRNYFFVSDLDD